MKSNGVLLTSSSSKFDLYQAVLSAARRLNLGKVWAGDANEKSVSRWFAEDFWNMPTTSAANREDIVSGLLIRGISYVIPSRDNELLFWSSIASELKLQGITVLVSDEPALISCLDKLEFSKLSTSGSIRLIPTFLPSDLPPSWSGVNSWVIKERFGSGSRLIQMTSDPKQLKKLAHNLLEPIIQPRVYGDEVSADMWIDSQGVVRGIVLRRRDSVTLGESKVTTTFRSAVLERDIKDFVANLASEGGLRGPIVLQGIAAPDGIFHVLEINPRFGGASTASIAVGLDSIYWTFAEASGANIDQLFHRKPSEIRQVKYETAKIFFLD